MKDFIPRNEEILEILLRFELEEKLSVIPTRQVFDKLQNAHAGQGLKYTALLNHINRNMEEWVTFQPYQGLQLTKKGRTWGLQIIRKHRLAERLLVDILNLDWKTAHLEACQLEHGLSDLVIGQIEKILGEKAIVCPHGSPIPSAAGKVVSMSYKKLSSISKPCKVIIKQVRCGNLDLLEKLGNFQLYPETKIIIGTIDPKKGLFKVHSNQSNQTILISFSEASDIFIELLN